MFLNEFTHADNTKMDKLARTLRENYSYELDLNAMTHQRASRIIHNATTKINESTDITRRIKLRLIVESLQLWTKASVQSELTDITETLDDDAVEEAKVILAAKEMSTKVQDMIEDAAKMQVQDLIPIIDAMRTDIGQVEADAFSQAADDAMAAIVDALKAGKNQLDDAIMGAQGIKTTDMEQTGPYNTDAEHDMDTDIDNEDDFGGDPTTITSNPSGRELKDEG